MQGDLEKAAAIRDQVIADTERLSSGHSQAPGRRRRSSHPGETLAKRRLLTVLVAECDRAGSAGHHGRVDLFGSAEATEEDIEQ